MHADHPAAWVPAPWFQTSVPQLQPGVIERPRLDALLDAHVGAHHLTLVAAPSGFGKTAAVAQWSRVTSYAVAWLTLTGTDTTTDRLLRGVVTALGPVTDSEPAIPTEQADLASARDLLLHAVRDLPTPTVLVVDDAQIAGDHLLTAVLGDLVEHGPSRLRVMVVGTGIHDPAIHRYVGAGRAALVGPGDLAMVADEVQAAAGALGVELADDAAAALSSSTGGWPIAVRLRLLAEDTGPAASSIDATADDPLDDYLEHVVFAGLDPGLVDFLLAATTVPRLDDRLAVTLTERDDAPAVLAACVRRSLFVDRYLAPDGQRLYQWHGAFAAACRRLLQQRDPARAVELRRRAARLLAGDFPLEAADLALLGEDPGLAVEIVLGQWLTLVIQSQAEDLLRLCVRLPGTQAQTPKLLLIQACCRDALGDRTGAAVLHERATAMLAATAEPSTRARLTSALVDLILSNDPTELIQACDRTDQLLRTASDLPDGISASALFLLGWTELRLRRNPPHAIELLQAALTESELVGPAIVTRRARSDLAFALAFGGELTAALALLETVDHDQHEWGYDNGITWFATGYVAFWQNRLGDAEQALTRVVRSEGSFWYAALARIFLALTAAAQGDARRQNGAEAGLRSVPDVGMRGVPFGTYKVLAAAKIAEARGLSTRAAALTERVGDLSFVPATLAIFAELRRRVGDLSGARRLLAGLGSSPAPSYVKVSALLTEALLHRESGDVEGAHLLMERSLDLAAPQGIARPYADGDELLRQVLVEHAAWGTSHDTFVADRLGELTRTDSQPQLGDLLSPREREILSYLRTVMSAGDIAAHLGVSVNTVKTHQRSIYRKLGVAGRRDAIKIRI